MDVASFKTLCPVWTHLNRSPIVRGAGACVFDQSDVRYLDFTSGIGVTALGHCHPRVVAAIQAQAERFLFGQINCMVPEVTLKYAEALRAVMPEGLDCFYFANSGAEVVEGAVKLAKAVTGRTNVIAFQGSFHGRTAMAMALTSSKTVYRAGYQPLPAGAYFAPFPYTFRYGWHEEQTIEFCLEELDRLLHSQTAADETAAILIEPVLGEGGIVPAPLPFLSALRRLCDDHGMLLIFDEIQCGFARSGTMWAHAPSGVVPDILLMAKAIASGVPMSAIAARRGLMEHWAPGTHGGTYGGGSAIAMAAASATLEIIVEERLAERAREHGAHLRHRLTELQSRFPVIADVRGIGLLMAIELVDQGAPAVALAKALQAECLERGLMILTCGSKGHVIRLLPPLIITAEELDEGIGILEAALHATTVRSGV